MRTSTSLVAVLTEPEAPTEPEVPGPGAAASEGGDASDVPAPRASGVASGVGEAGAMGVSATGATGVSAGPDEPDCDGKLIDEGISTSLGSGLGAGAVVDRVLSAAEVGLERAHHPLAVLGLETGQRFDICEERVAATGELDDLLFETAPLGFALAAGLGLGVGDETPRRHLGVVEHLARLRRRLRDGFVGRALGEQQRAVEDVLGLPGPRRLALRRGQSLLELGHPLVRRIDRGCGALEELVDLVTAVAPHLGVNLGIAELSRCDLHITPS